MLEDDGIKTIIVGFGIGTNAQFNAVAENGGTPYTEALDATDPGQLEKILAEVLDSVVSCEYEIDEPSASADPDKVNFYFEDEVVAQDEACSNGSGWRWVDKEHTKIDFCPEDCKRLKAGDVDEISAEFGCPTHVE